ncbi:glycosyltransferase family 39 protein [Nocardia sp. BMG51109]|uniref:glycosyltransferase family 39 protein n=1 Tax=Nocardia sp. BMG51109 TaxID=1056816 RepID=UPI000684F017|nr:glycosyltransferase family 39 protein [Nocardia sp. BMG51109]
MTATVLAPVDLPAEDARPENGRARLWRRLSLVGLLAVTAVLYLWNLGASGWANQFYAAAVQAGSTSWKAMLFGSSDAANAITVDKIPGALWPMDLSARLFGFNSWSLLVPQALAGVAAVGVLYATVRRVGGHWSAIFAGAALALTPVAALMFRYNNPDALLVLLLTVAAYCVLRAIEKDSAAWWLPLAGVAVGFGFLTKMMQAFLVLPAFALVYLLAAQVPWRARIVRSVAAVLALVVSAGWYLVLVELWPADSRPYIGGSQDNSIVELTLGYNGFGRLTGNEVGGLGNTNWDAGWDRLFGSQMGGQIAWLLPAALVLGVAGLWALRRAPRTDARRAALLLWLGWLIVTGAVFSFSDGILHPYYTVALAPAIAGAVGLGAGLMWQRRKDIRAAAVLSGALVVTVVLAYELLRRASDWLSWLAPAIVVVGVLAAVLLLAQTRLPKAVAVVAVTGALVAGLAGPAAYTLATVSTTQSGAMPSAGPAGVGFPGPGGGPRRDGGGPGMHGRGGPAMHGRAGAATPSGTDGTAGQSGTAGQPGAAGTAGQSGAAGTAGQSGAAGTAGQSGAAGTAGQSGAAGTAGQSGAAGTAEQSGAAGQPGTAGTAGQSRTTGAAGQQGTADPGGTTGRTGGAPMGGPFGSTKPGANLVTALQADAGDYTWAAAVIGSDNAAGYQLAIDSPVMAMGGYNGTDPSPTLERFEQYVAQHEIHYFIDGSVMFGMRGATSGSRASGEIAAWVRERFTAQTIDSVTVYDLTAPRE